jgi:hypothetical protein
MASLGAVHRDAGLFIVWVLLLAMAGVVFLSIESPSGTGWIRAETLYVALLELQTGFLLLIWPLWLGRSLKGAPASRAVVQAAGLLLLSFPLNVAAHALGHGGPGALLGGSAVAASCALLAAGIFGWGARAGVDVQPYYFLGVFVTQALFPFVGYLFLEFAGAPTLALMGLLCPFWTATRLGGEAAPFVQAGLFLGGAALFGAAALRARPGRAA